LDCPGAYYSRDTGGGKQTSVTPHSSLTPHRHLMTGIGSYFYIVWAIWLRHCLNERQDEYVLKWPSMMWSIPEVVPRLEAEKSSSYRKSLNGYMNGETKAKSEDRKSV
jgi:dihydroceramidase